MPDIFIRNNDKRGKHKKEGGDSVRSNFAKKKSKDSIVGRKSHKEYGHTHNPLSAFSLHPDKVEFIAKDPEESVVLLLRKHPITNLPWLVVSIIMIVAPFFFEIIDFYSFLPSSYKFVINLVWLLFTTSFILEKFLQWFFNVNIITDERIIDVNFYNLIYREISDANIDQIQDVTVEVGGGTGTFFNYGNVVVQTAAEVLKIDFENVPRPDEIAKVLRSLRVEEEREKLEGRVR